MRAAIGIVLAVVVLGGGVARIRADRAENQRLQTALARTKEQQWRAARAARGVPDAERTKPAEAGARRDPLAVQVAAARAEVARLERQANDQFARLARAEPSRDPEAGMTRLEDLENVGRGTPAAAFQTLAWAGLHGDANAMASAIGFAPEARREMEAVIAALPAAERAKYPTPETLAALFLAQGFVNLSGIQIVDTRFTGPDMAELTVRGLVYTDQPLAMHRGPGGWQLWEGKPQVAWLREELAKRD